jgi:hypothetical protein
VHGLYRTYHRLCIVLDTPDGTPRCVGHVKCRFSPFGDTVSVVARLWMVCAKRTIGSESFWMHPMVLLGDEAKLEAPFGPFGDSANLDAI